MLELDIAIRPKPPYIKRVHIDRQATPRGAADSSGHSLPHLRAREASSQVSFSLQTPECKSTPMGLDVVVHLNNEVGMENALMAAQDSAYTQLKVRPRSLGILVIKHQPRARAGHGEQHQLPVRRARGEHARGEPRVRQAR